METVNSERLDWHKLRTVGTIDTNVLPVAVQDADTHEMIMIAYLSREALAETDRTGRAVFYSTSRHQLHRKGETAGDVLEVVSLRVNCDLNSVLMKAKKRGTGACHERDTDGDHYTSCFFRELVPDREKRCIAGIPKAAYTGKGHAGKSVIKITTSQSAAVATNAIGISLVSRSDLFWVMLVGGVIG